MNGDGCERYDERLEIGEGVNDERWMVLIDDWTAGNKSLFSCKNFYNFDTVALLFVFGNYYPIIG